jgi:glutathione S-transferase
MNGEKVNKNLGQEYQLYWERMSGAIAPQCLLEEMGLAWRKVPIDMAAAAHESPDYVAVNPTMRIPALHTPTGKTIGETGAIIIMLGEWHPESRFVPGPGEADRADFLFWLFYMASVGYPTFSRAWHPEQFTQEENAHGSIREVAEADLDVLFGVLDGGIEGEATFLHRGFSALDIYLTMIARWHPDREALFSKYAKVAAVCEATEKRPACGAVMEEHFGQ